MAGLLSIQLGNATNAKAVPLRLPSGDGDAVIGFAAVLSGVSNPVSGSKTPTLALRAATPGVLDPGKGLEAETSAVMASSDRFAFNPERASETLSSTPVKPSDSAPLSVGNAPEMPLSTGIKSSRSGASTHVAPAQTTSPHGQTSAASQNASPNTVTEGIAATLLPAPSSVVPGGKNPRGDGVGLQPAPLAQDGNVQAPPEDASSISGPVSDAALGMQSGNARNRAPPGEPTAASLPAAASGKNPDDDGGIHPRLHRRSTKSSVPANQGRGVATVPVTKVGDASQLPAATVSLPVTVPTPSPDTAVDPAARTKIDGGDNPSDPHRPGLGSPDKAQLASENGPPERISLSTTAGRSGETCCTI